MFYKNKFFGLMLVVVMVLAVSVQAFASGNVRSGTAIENSVQQALNSNTGTNTNVNQNNDNSVQNTVDSVVNDMIDTSVTTEQVTNRLERMGNGVLSITQTAGKYICITVFIACCVISLIGIFNKRLLAGGLIGLGFSGFAYAGITYGREIVRWIAAWAAS